MNIDSVIDSVMQFYSWMSLQTGIKSWQLLTIALVVLFSLIFLLRYMRKARLKTIHILQRADRSEIIGINLSGRPDNYQSQQEYRTKQATIIPEEDEQRPWGQSTKEWRQLREKIRELQHDIAKHERTEKHLKEQITELTGTNKKLQTEINERTQIEQELKERLNKFISSKSMTKEETDTIKNEFSAGNKEKLEKQEQLKKIAVAEEAKQKYSEFVQTNQKTEQIPPISAEQDTNLKELLPKSIENKEGIVSETYKNIEEDEITEKEHSIPLDIKELKAIADLAKRLQARSQQRQNE